MSDSSLGLTAVVATTKTARTLTRQTSSLVWQERPQTPAGWAVFTTALLAAALAYELKLQKQLTCPPRVFLQPGDDSSSKKNDTNNLYNLDNDAIQRIYDILTTNGGILAQAVQPSLWVGTRGSLASILALVAGIPHSKNCFRFRQILTAPLDGAILALDFEVPCDPIHPEHNTKQIFSSRPIDKPAVIILHGINNDSNSGYVRSLQRTLTNRGKIAIGLNFRGCGGTPLAAPRGYSGAYTNDLRSVVHHIESRLAPGVPLLLVGFSLGANLITKYLGEEGLSGTLPSCVAGGASLGNPLEIHSKKNVHFPFSQLIGQGVKLYLIEHWRVFKEGFAQYPEQNRQIKQALMSVTVDQFDAAVAPIILRNDPYYPFTSRIGYKDVEEFWQDACSYRFIKHISVPLLQIIAGDDKLVYHSFQQKLTHSIRNPNVISVETQCGGHLGWQESPPPSKAPAEDGFGGGPSWASRATADFIDAILETRKQTPTATTAAITSNRARQSKVSIETWEQPPPVSSFPSTKKPIPILRSRL